jgi:hypothetical protein
MVSQDASACIQLVKPPPSSHGAIILFSSHSRCATMSTCDSSQAVNDVRRRTQFAHGLCRSFLRWQYRQVSYIFALTLIESETLNIHRRISPFFCSSSISENSLPVRTNPADSSIHYVIHTHTTEVFQRIPCYVFLPC